MIIFFHMGKMYHMCSEVNHQCTDIESPVRSKVDSDITTRGKGKERMRKQPDGHGDECETETGG